MAPDSRALPLQPFGHAPQPRWRRLLERRANALRDVLPAALRGRPDAVHDARVASRRLREALSLVKALYPEAKIGKAQRRARRVTRVFGRLRELDVGLELLADIGTTRPELSGDVQSARAMLNERHRKRAEALADEPADLPRKIAQGVEKILRQIEPPVDLKWQQAVAVQIAKRRQRLVRALDATRVLYDAESLHAVRIAVKRLRYSVELAADLSGFAGGPPLATLKKFQELLGRMHDLHVLAEHLRVADASRRFERLSDHLEQEARRLHADYLDRASQLGPAAADCHRRFSLRALPRPRPAQSDLSHGLRNRRRHRA